MPESGIVFTTGQSVTPGRMAYGRVVMLIDILYVEIIGSEVEDIALIVGFDILWVLEGRVEGLVLSEEAVKQGRLVTWPQRRLLLLINLSH